MYGIRPLSSPSPVARNFILAWFISYVFTVFCNIVVKWKSSNKESQNKIIFENIKDNIDEEICVRLFDLCFVKQKWNLWNV